MLAPELLEMLCCPETHNDLKLASKEQVTLLNQMILNNQLKNRSGSLVTEPVQGVLIRIDEQRAYLVRHGIPIMLIEEAIDCATLFSDTKYQPSNEGS